MAWRDANDRYFNRVLTEIDINARFELERAKILLKMVTKKNREEAAKELNKAYASFYEIFHNTFLGTHWTPTIRDVGFSSTSPLPLTEVGIHYKDLSRKWARKKRALGAGAPNFFKFKATLNQSFVGPQPKGSSPSLEAYLENHWQGIIKKRLGIFTADDIVILNSKGQEVRSRRGFLATKAEIDAKTKEMERLFSRDPKLAAQLIADYTRELKQSPFKRLQALNQVTKPKWTGHGDMKTQESFTLGFRPLRDINYRALLTSRYQVELAKKFIPMAENNKTTGFALSKLTNNHYGGKGLNNPIRPTIGPLLFWYHRVKLPHVFREFYKTKGLVGR